MDSALCRRFDWVAVKLILPEPDHWTEAVEKARMTHKPPADDAHRCFSRGTAR